MTIYLVTQGPLDAEIPPMAMCIHSTKERAIDCVVARKATETLPWAYAIEEWPVDSGKACDVDGFDPYTEYL